MAGLQVRYTAGHGGLVVAKPTVSSSQKPCNQKYCSCSKNSLEGERPLRVVLGCQWEIWYPFPFCAKIIILYEPTILNTLSQIRCSQTTLKNNIIGLPLLRMPL